LHLQQLCHTNNSVKSLILVSLHYSCTVFIKVFHKLIGCFEENLGLRQEIDLWQKRSLTSLSNHVRPFSLPCGVWLFSLHLFPLPPPAQVRFEQQFNPSRHESEINLVVIISLGARGEIYGTYWMLKTLVSYQDAAAICVCSMIKPWFYFTVSEQVTSSEYNKRM